MFICFIAAVCFFFLLSNIYEIQENETSFFHQFGLPGKASFCHHIAVPYITGT